MTFCGRWKFSFWKFGQILIIRSKKIFCFAFVKTKKNPKDKIKFWNICLIIVIKCLTNYLHELRLVCSIFVSFFNISIYSNFTSSEIDDFFRNFFAVVVAVILDRFSSCAFKILNTHIKKNFDICRQNREF